jgi:1-acyl-sn-glycerol-3-phosphate acyltransferase
MNLLKNIFGRILAVWALLLFVITMLIFFIPIWASGLWPEPKRTSLFISIARVWMGIYLPLVGLRIKIKGRGHFKKNENYIVVCNHNSMIDVPVTTPYIPGINKTIAKIEMSRIPLFGIIYKRGSVLVDRKNEASRRESMLKMKGVLELGMHMCVYPEGTRNKTDKPLKDFHDGAFRLAIETKKSIIPALIFNTRKVMPAGKLFFLWPAKIEMHFLEPVTISSTDTVQLVREKVFQLMWDYYSSNTY